MPALLDLLAPPTCAICRAAGPLLCRRCMESLPLLDGPCCARCGAPTVRPVDDCAGCRGRRLGFASAAAALRYDDPAARSLVHGLKDGGLRALAAPAAGLMAMVIPRPDGDLLTWVPADPMRQALRGYHPPRLLAEELAGRWGLPPRPLLDGPLWRRPQRGLPRDGRRRNVRGAFTARGAVAGRVILVDDVLTTGATLSAAARVLRSAGADAVVAVTLARADDH
ncbi:MAG TPA: ComF family protein [Gaiellales bacterium]|nr:ComF family protein [Gaiellales bacterium]